MTGVILCGGKSTRMQKDKGLMMHGTVTWAKKLALQLHPICNNLVISVNPHQQGYQTALANYPCITDDDTLDLHGPLLGLLSVHQHFPMEDIFLLACDMQQMQTDVLAALAAAHKTNMGYDAWVFVQPGGTPEPLAGIYAGKALAQILADHRNAALARHSMKYILEKMNVFTLPIPEAWDGCFANFNTPDAISSLK